MSDYIERLKTEYPPFEDFIERKACSVCVNYHYDRMHSSSWDSCPCSSCTSGDNFEASKSAYECHKADYYSPWYGR